MLLVREGHRLVAEAQSRDIVVRLLGGVAIVAHCESVQAAGGHRELGDIDVIVSKKDARHLASWLEDDGYVPEQRFNALHGDRRMIFSGQVGRLDVLVGTFEMCHVINLESRLSMDSPTVTITDLLLTKLQVVELNEKDADDIVAILSEHDVGKEEGDFVSTDRMERVVFSDWGLWRTTTGTLDQLSQVVTDPIILGRIAALRQALEKAPKSRRFQVRASVGERIRWYQLPDDVPGS
jgi:hypothetical protein